MMVEITCNGVSKIIPCPEDTLLLGLGISHPNGNVNVVRSDEDIFGDSLEMIEKKLLDHTTIRLLCYKSSSKSHQNLIGSYHGMKYLEFVDSCLELTVTIV